MKLDPDRASWPRPPAGRTVDDAEQRPDPEAPTRPVCHGSIADEAHPSRLMAWRASLLRRRVLGDGRRLPIGGALLFESFSFLLKDP